jgi:O-antigen/teichoic acid export membrane protein
MRFLGIIVSTPRIRPEQFGILASAVMVCGLATTIREIGQSSALLSNQESQPGYARTHLLLTLITSAVALILTLGGVFVFSSLSDLRPLWPLLLFLITFEAITFTPMIVAQKKFSFGGLAIIEMLAVATWLLFTFLAALRYPVATALLAAKVGEAGVRGLILFGWQFRTLCEGKSSTRIWRYYFRFAKILAPKAWIETLGANLDVFLLRIFTGNLEIGVYDRTSQLLRIPLSLSVNLVDAVAGASYSREQSSPHVLARTLGSFSLVVLAGAVAGTAIVQLFLSFLAGPLLGTGWKQSIEEIWPWAIPVAIFRPLFWNYNIFFQTTGRPKELLLTLTIGLFLFLCLGLILTPLLSVRGIFIAAAVANFLTLLFQMHWARTIREGASVTAKMPCSSEPGTISTKITDRLSRPNEAI